MTTEEIEERITDIAEMKGDDEMANVAEDRLREDFIAYVAELEDGLPSLSEKAKLVLTTGEIEFARWYD